MFKVKKNTRMTSMATNDVVMVLVFLLLNLNMQLSAGYINFIVFKVIASYSEFKSYPGVFKSCYSYSKT